MQRFKSFLSEALGDFLWVVILVPILAISWYGFYTVACAVGITPVFAAGMSAAFDGVAIFAARIGLKHRRKGFSGYLARITVLLFVVLGAFVQAYHGKTQTWIHAHSWIVWAIVPVAAAIAYELHLGWVHRKQLISRGYSHPSAKSGFGPATWIHFPRETMQEYRDVLRARRSYIARTNLKRFEIEEASQPELVLPMQDLDPLPEPLRAVPAQKRSKPIRPRRSNGKRGRMAYDEHIRKWCRDEGIPLLSDGRVSMNGLNAYRAAHPTTRSPAA